jgi:hypothetical protein
VTRAINNMGLIETVNAGGRLLCMIIRSGFTAAKTTFVTPPDVNVQVGFIVYPGGHEIPRHLHLPVERQLVGTFEVLLVQRGRCELDVYDESKNCVATTELAQGDTLIMVRGGHGFRMVEDTVLLEVKQGPYPGVAEKDRF